MPVIGTVTCPNCGNDNATAYHRDNQDHYYCGPCSYFGTISRIDGLPTHDKYRRPCITCGYLSKGRQTIPTDWKCTRCKNIRKHPLCTAPDCTLRSVENTRTPPWLPWCVDHRNEHLGATATGITRRDRKRRLGKRARQSWAYKKVKDAALKRDNYTCTWCGHDGTTDRGRLEVDHIQEEWEAPQLLMDLDNLQTLCRACHAAKGVAVRAALYELARENPLHYTAIADRLIAHTRDRNGTLST